MKITGLGVIKSSVDVISASAAKTGEVALRDLVIEKVFCVVSFVSVQELVQSDM